MLIDEQNLRKQIKMLKLNGRTYRSIAEEADVGYKTLTNFCNGYRETLTKENKEKIINFLSKYE